MSRGKGRKYPRSQQLAIRTAEQRTDASYVFMTDSNQAEVSRAFNSAVNEFSGRVSAAHRTSYRDIGGSGISGRPGLTSRDYDLHRPDEARPQNVKETMLMADKCYEDHGLIKNIIDLMGDFACQGIRLVHPNKQIEKFYRNWFKRVNGIERSERFLNILYRLGNVVVRKQNAKLTKRAKDRLFKTSAEAEIDIEQMKVSKNEVPWKYTFLHPATVEVVGGALASFVGSPTYALKMPASLRRVITTPKTAEEKSLVSKLPAEIRQAASSNKSVPLPKDRVSVYHYKKDDWQSWAAPMIGAILIDISLYEKLKLADRAALDGAISNIRIFKLGSLEHKIIPTATAAAKLAQILEGNTNVGTLDLIWGPDIELIESKTAVHQFLGQSKYEPTLMAIYAGIGIPPTLTGTFGATGTTNNFVALKTLTQRLEYGRRVLMDFWTKELRQVQEAMGFRFPATVEFDHPNLGDDVAEKALMIQLADRSLISDELLQHHFNHDPDMERIRINREAKQREQGKMVPKAGAFHDPQFGVALKKMALQTGVLTPNQVGLREDEIRKDLKLYPKGKGEKNALEFRNTGMGQKGPAAKKKGQPGQGRPKNKKDSTKRATKTFKPKTKAYELAAVEMWAQIAQHAISEVITPIALASFNKKNLRQLTAAEADKLEDIRFGVLCNLDPMSDVSEASIHKALDNPIPDDMKYTYGEWIKGIGEELDRELNTSEKRYAQAALYALYHGEDEDG